MAKETFEFQAETKQLLDLMVHSIYTNHEIFLRELISNASDAIDKLHYESLTNNDLLEGDTAFEIHLTPDEDKHTLTISDNGIGMNKDELMQNLGTIAKSGTKAFLEKLKEAQEGGSVDKDLIGQFGVGFYSAFMVADTVTVVTRKAGEREAYKWESAGDGQYTLETCEKPKHGTTIILTLGKEFCGSETEENYTDKYLLESLVKKYSDYIRYPITMDFTTKENARTPTERLLKTRRKKNIRKRGPSTPCSPCGPAINRTLSPKNTVNFSSISSTNGTNRWKFSTAASKAASNTHRCCSFRAAPPSTCTTPTMNRACSSIRATSSSWINARICCLITCAS